MNRRHFMGLGGIVLLAGCGRAARLNPFTWFGRGEPARRVEPVEVATVEDPRPLIDRVTRLEIARTPGGAIVRATGLPPVQGWHSAGLVRSGTDEPGLLAFQFRALPPVQPQRASRPESREIVVATYLTDQELAPVREIRVSAARNALASRR